jgi:hypothetical protein
LEKLLLKESIEDVIIQEHYEQRFFDLEYIFQQDHAGSKISDSKNLELWLSQLTQKRHIAMNPALYKLIVS